MNFFDFSLKSDPPFTLSGSYNFFVEVTSHGQLPYHNSIICINAYSNSTKKTPIACQFKWCKLNEDKIIQQLDISSNSNIFSPLDIGYKFRIELKPMEEGFNGICIINISSIKLDPNIKSVLEGILRVGGSTFPLSLYIDNKEFSASFLLTDEKIRIVWQNEKGEKSIVFPYSINLPKLELSFLDLTKVTIFSQNEDSNQYIDKLINNEKNNEKLILKFSSKTTRDLLILGWRVFASKKYLRDSKSIIFSENFFGTDTKLFKLKEEQNLLGDILLEIGMLKNENIIFFEQIRNLKNDKDEYVQQIKDLEAEIIETIDTYTQLISEMNGKPEFQRLGSLKDDFELKRRNKELENKNMELEKRIESIIEELDVTRNLFKEDKNYLSRQNSDNNKNGNSEEIELLKIRNNILENENIGLKQISTNYWSLQEKFRVINEKNKELEKKIETLINENSKFKEKSQVFDLINGKNDYALKIVDQDREIKILSLELKKSKEINQTLALELEVLSKEFGKQNNGLLKRENENLIATQNQMSRKIDSLKKEVESKNSSLLIDNLTKTNEKLIFENQKLIEELKKKADELSIKSSNRGTRELELENRMLRDKNESLQIEKDKIIVEFSKIKK